MAENIPLSTIGVIVSYCAETTAGTRPTTGYTKLKGIMSTPDYSVAPSTADATSFDNVEFTTKLKLLKEIPDNLEFGMRFGQEAYNSWTAMCTTYSALTGGKALWMCIDIPGFNKSIFQKVEPVAIGIPAMEQNSGIDVTCYATPIGEPVFDSDPTYA